MHELQYILAAGQIGVIGVGVLDEALEDELVVGKLLHGLDEEVVEREFSLVLARHRLQKLGKRRLGRFSRSNSIFRFIPIIYKRYVGF